MQLEAFPEIAGSPSKAAKGAAKGKSPKNTKTASERKSGPKTRNAYHAQLEEKCGLVEVIELLHPHLKGLVAIDGESFPCPMPMHLDGDGRQTRVEHGRKWDKPVWKCGAGCVKSKGNDTLDMLMGSLGIPYPKAITLWAKLGAAPKSKRRAIIKQQFPNWYDQGGKAA